MHFACYLLGGLGGYCGGLLDCQDGSEPSETDDRVDIWLREVPCVGESGASGVSGMKQQSGV